MQTHTRTLSPSSLPVFRQIHPTKFGLYQIIIKNKITNQKKMMIKLELAAGDTMTLLRLMLYCASSRNLP
jgi:hypothetical protein